MSKNENMITVTLNSINNQIEIYNSIKTTISIIVAIFWIIFSTIKKWEYYFYFFSDFKLDIYSIYLFFFIILVTLTVYFTQINFKLFNVKHINKNDDDLLDKIENILENNEKMIINFRNKNYFYLKVIIWIITFLLTYILFYDFINNYKSIFQVFFYIWIWFFLCYLFFVRNKNYNEQVIINENIVDKQNNYTNEDEMLFWWMFDDEDILKEKYYDEANRLSALWVIEDFSENPINYQINDYVERGFLIKVWMKVSPIEISEKCEWKFADINVSNEICSYVEEALKQWYIKSTPLFKPNELVTIEESIDLIFKIRWLDIEKYKSEIIKIFKEEWIEISLKNNITKWELYKITDYAITISTTPNLNTNIDLKDLYG